LLFDFCLRNTFALQPFAEQNPTWPNATKPTDAHNCCVDVLAATACCSKLPTTFLHQKKTGALHFFGKTQPNSFFLAEQSRLSRTRQKCACVL
jgi:hypothetical protein